MFKYLPLTEDNLQAMLAVIRVRHIDDLLSDVPSSIRLKQPYQLLPRLSESQIRKHLKASQGKVLQSFRGFGVYEHERPAIIDALSSRQEFLTSYTPYQPEVAQGTLQYIFEWQSMITQLTGMDVSNASMYDGPTALSEAMVMAVAVTNIKRVIVASPLLPQVNEVIKTYAKHRGIQIEILGPKDGLIDRQALTKAMETPFAGVIFSYPNRFGLIEYYADLAPLIKAKKALVISYNDPFALARLKTPRSLGADIVCGEAQSLGLNPNFGGPFIGYLTTLNEWVRKMPGRICGYTKDNRGQRGFVLTLQTREQHIRREKANSNICSNQSLLALQATIYMSALGKQGMVKAFDQACQVTRYLVDQLLATGLFTLSYAAPYAYETTLTSKIDVFKLEKALLKKDILFGYPLSNQQVVIYGSDTKTKADIDVLVQAIKEVQHDLH
ncbi:MAG: aminomethyl-transferring glycine dehydrogenase subunit GcvPA [Bacilli bacterium]